MISLVSVGPKDGKFEVRLHGSGGKIKVAETFDAYTWANQAAIEWRELVRFPEGSACTPFSVRISLWDEFGEEL